MGTYAGCRSSSTTPIVDIVSLRLEEERCGEVNDISWRSPRDIPKETSMRLLRNLIERDLRMFCECVLDVL